MRSKLFAAVAAVLVVGSGSVAEEESSNMTTLERLERFQLWNECKPVFLLVESLKNDATDKGLTVERIETAVRSRLRAAKLYAESARVHYLYVNVNVNGPAFNVSLELNKLVTDSVSDISANATTWNTGGVGVQSGSGAGLILQAVSEYTDHFIDEYLRVNAEAC